jgi:hypothetical protein
MDATELCFTPATTLADAIRARTLSPVEIVDARDQFAKTRLASEF